MEKYGVVNAELVKNASEDDEKIIEADSNAGREVTNLADTVAKLKTKQATVKEK